MKRLSFLPRFSTKVKPGSTFLTIRSEDCTVENGDELEFVDDMKGPIGFGGCLARAKLTLAPERAIILDCRPHPQLLPFNGVCDDIELLNAFAIADGFISYREMFDWAFQRYAMKRCKLLLCGVKA